MHDVDQRTLFRLGAVSEALTAVTVNGLIRRGLLDWDASVAHYLPELSSASRIRSVSEEITERITFTRAPARAREPNGGYWDLCTVKDLALHNSSRLPPTAAGYGLHGMPVLDQAQLIKTVKYFTGTGPSVSSYGRLRSEPSAFNYALLGLIIEKIGQDLLRHGGKAWYDSLKAALLERRMPWGTTARTAELRGKGNGVVSHRLVNDRRPEKTYIEMSRWMAGEDDVFAPALGLFSNLEDMVHFCCWLLDSIKHRPLEMTPMFPRDNPAQPASPSTRSSQRLGWTVTTIPLTDVSTKVDDPRRSPGERTRSLSRRVSGASSLPGSSIRIYRSKSNGIDHSTSVTLCPGLDFAVVVLSNPSDGVDFAEHVTQVILEAVCPSTPPPDICALAIEEARLNRKWYRDKILTPWVKARDLGSFFRGYSSTDVDQLRTLVLQTVGIYYHEGLERYITLSAHERQMTLSSGQAYGTDSSHTNDGAGRIDLDMDPLKTSPRLEAMARMCQMAMAFDDNYPHQIIALVPHHADLRTVAGLRTEWWSYLPTMEKDLYAAGCGHLRAMEQSLVRIERSSPTDVMAILVDIGGRTVRFDRVAMAHVGGTADTDWPYEIRRDHRRLDDSFDRIDLARLDDGLQRK